MQRLQILTAFLVATILSACGPSSVEPDPELYGTWVEPRFGYELTFREDGTMNWFGQEGTWHVVDNTGFFACRNPLYCDKHIVLEGIAGSSDKGLEYDGADLRRRPNIFEFAARGSVPMSEGQNGRQLRGPLYRQGSYPENFMPAPLERVPALPETDSGSYGFNLYEDENGLIAKQDGALYRFDETSNSWTELFSSSAGFWVYINDSMLYVLPTDSPNSQIITTHPHPVTSNDGGHVSLDGGITWTTIPTLNFELGEANGVHPVNGIVHNHIVVVVRYSRLTEDENGTVSSEDLRNEIWTLDTSRTQPQWVLKRTFNEPEWSPWSASSASGLITYTPHASSDLANEVLVSADYGNTWTTIEAPCADLAHHPAGLYCADLTSSESSVVHWYDYAANTWTQHTVNLQGSILSSNPLTDGFYFGRDEQIWSWTTDGTETFVASVESYLPYNIVDSSSWGRLRLVLRDDSVTLFHHGIWRAEF